MNEKFKVRFNFISLVIIGALIGFCAGVVTIPFSLLNVLNSEIGSEIGAMGTLILVPITPIIGLINGAILGVLAYPLYWWLSQKVGFTFKGKIYVIE